MQVIELKAGDLLINKSVKKAAYDNHGTKVLEVGYSAPGSQLFVSLFMGTVEPIAVNTFDPEIMLQRMGYARDGSGLLAEIAAERQNQIEKGYDAAHDDEHVCDEISAAATVLVMPDACRDWDASSTGYGDKLLDAMMPDYWLPMKDKGRRQNLITGIAMLVAEVERLDRLESKGGAE